MAPLRWRHGGAAEGIHNERLRARSDIGATRLTSGDQGQVGQGLATRHRKV